MTPEELSEIIDKIGSPFNIVDSRFEKGNIRGHAYYSKPELQEEFAYLSSASLIYSYELFKTEEIFELDKDDVTPLELVNLEHLYSFLTQSRYYIIEKYTLKKMNTKEILMQQKLIN